MKKVFTIIAIALASILCVGCAEDYSDDIKTLQDQINALASDKINPISTQLSNVESSITSLQNTQHDLTEYISLLFDQLDVLEKADQSLSDQLADYKKSLESTIAALQEKDKQLQQQIDDLKAYVEKGVADAKDWANGTFVTMEKYQETADIIADIQAQMEKVSTITGPVSQEDLTNSIKASEESIKAWVHTLFSGYMTEEQAEAKLATFKDELSADMAKSYEEKTAKIKDEVTEAYNAAIKKAIDEYNGTITATIAADIATINGKVEALSEDVADLQARVSQLEDRVSLLEKLLGVKWSVKGTVDDGAGKTWEATLLAWKDGSYTIKEWYGTEGYDLNFTVNEGGTITVTNMTETDGYYYVAASADKTICIDTRSYEGYGDYSKFEGNKDEGEVWFWSYETKGYYDFTWPVVEIVPVTIDEIVGTYSQDNTYQFWYNSDWNNYSSTNDITVTKVDDKTVGIVGFMYSAEDGGKTINATLDPETAILTIEPQMIDSWYKLAGQNAITESVSATCVNGTIVFGKWSAWYNGSAYGYSTKTVLTKK
jgi:outer membrane murein-binding lipoprotein Lpp/regulator of replication initiation timing